MTEPEMTCQELVELVTAHFDDALTDEDRARFDEHLGGCQACPAYVEQMRVTIALLGRLEPEPVAPETERSLLAAFRDRRAGR
jgi:anti-sigma factor RsiW